MLEPQETITIDIHYYPAQFRARTKKRVILLAKSRRKSNNNNRSTRKIYKLVAIARIITLAYFKS